VAVRKATGEKGNDMSKKASVKVSPDLGAHLAEKKTMPRCVLCGVAPCACPPFESDAYMAQLNRVHGN
jgi:hypothetical protein